MGLNLSIKFVVNIKNQKIFSSNTKVTMECSEFKDSVKTDSHRSNFAFESEAKS